MSTVGLTKSLGSCHPASMSWTTTQQSGCRSDSLRLFVRTAGSTSSMLWRDCTGSTGHVPTNRPARAADHTLRIEPVQDAIVGDARRSIWIMQVAVGFFLLIACANLANLLMARAESRRREFAVRAALGASRSRLLRQTMTEGVMLCAAGGMLGLWLARVAVQALIRAYPTSVPRMSEIAIDLSVLLFAIGVSMATEVRRADGC